MKVMTWPSASRISFRTALSRSSNSPRYFAPATIDARSSETTRRPLQRVGHVAGHHALGEALDDGGLADAGLADQHRVVLGAPGQHLHHAADLGVAADHRVELALAGALGEVDGVLVERRLAALGLGRGDPLVAAGRRRTPWSASRSSTPRSVRIFLASVCDRRQCEQQVLGGHERVARAARRGSRRRPARGRGRPTSPAG